MTLTRKEVEHIAALARLELTAAEVERYSRQLSDILEYAERLQQVDTSHVPPTASVLPAALRLREDTPRPGLSIETLLSTAPQTDSGQFRVPPVLDAHD
ncbi:MAG TPA: Asp-tRNA(Asn)/Glu-tRNA(Gln) amidotransferase subunit GatC [Anaerolineaceae bacterium]